MKAFDIAKTICMAVSALLMVCGCVSYRFYSEMQNGQDKKQDFVVTGKYRIAHVEIAKDGYLFYIARFGHPVFADNGVGLRNAIMQEYPNVFVDDTTVTPIDIILQQKNLRNEYGWTQIFTVFSLGILPHWEHESFDWAVSIRHAASASPCSSEDAHFDWATTGAGTPLAFFATYGSVRNAHEECSGHGVIDTFHHEACNVFSKTIADCVVAQIKHMEDNSKLADSVRIPREVSPVQNETASANDEISASANGVEAKLETVKGLYEKGLISEDEYKRKRAEILSQL